MTSAVNRNTKSEPSQITPPTLAQRILSKLQQENRRQHSDVDVQTFCRAFASFINIRRSVREDTTLNSRTQRNAEFLVRCCQDKLLQVTGTNEPSTEDIFNHVVDKAAKKNSNFSTTTHTFDNLVGRLQDIYGEAKHSVSPNKHPHQSTKAMHNKIWRPTFVNALRYPASIENVEMASSLQPVLATLETSPPIDLEALSFNYATAGDPSGEQYQFNKVARAVSKALHQLQQNAMDKDQASQQAFQSLRARGSSTKSTVPLYTDGIKHYVQKIQVLAQKVEKKAKDEFPIKILHRAVQNIREEMHCLPTGPRQEVSKWCAAMEKALTSGCIMDVQETLSLSGSQILDTVVSSSPLSRLWTYIRSNLHLGQYLQIPSQRHAVLRWCKQMKNALKAKSLKRVHALMCSRGARILGACQSAQLSEAWRHVSLQVKSVSRMQYAHVFSMEKIEALLTRKGVAITTSMHASVKAIQVHASKIERISAAAMSSAASGNDKSSEMTVITAKQCQIITRWCKFIHRALQEKSLKKVMKFMRSSSSPGARLLMELRGAQRSGVQKVTTDQCDKLRAGDIFAEQNLSQLCAAWDNVSIHMEQLLGMQKGGDSAQKNPTEWHDAVLHVEMRHIASGQMDAWSVTFLREFGIHVEATV